MFEAPENRLSFSLNGIKFDEDISEILRFDPENMVQELIEHSPAFAYIASIEADVAEAVVEMKRIRDRLHDELLLELREEKEAHGRNFTVAMQEAVVQQNASMIEANDKVESIEKYQRRLSKLLRAFEMRKDTLAEASRWLSRSETPPYVKPEPKEAVKTAKAKKVE